MRGHDDPTLPIVEVPLISLRGGPDLVVVTFGVPLSEFTCIPSPGVAKVQAALRRRGLDPDSYTSSPFLVRQVSPVLVGGAS